MMHRKHNSPTAAMHFADFYSYQKKYNTAERQ